MLAHFNNFYYKFYKFGGETSHESLAASFYNIQTLLVYHWTCKQIWKDEIYNFPSKYLLLNS